MYKISIVIPTRDREVKFTKTIEALQLCTCHPENLELLIIVNDDDLVSQTYVKKVMARHGMLKHKLLLRPYSIALNRDYYNWAADQATGDLVWIYADDLIVVAPNWDTTVNEQVGNMYTRNPDGVFIVSIKDNTPPPSHRLPKFPCFPMFTRQAREALGFWLHPKPNNWGVDYIMYMIFGPLGRICNIHDRNYINHVSYHSHQEQPDQTNVRIGSVFNSTKMIPHHNTDRILAEEVPLIQQQLRDYLKEKGVTI